MNEHHTAARLPATAVAGLLAMELSPGTTTEHAALVQDAAARLAALVGRDLVAQVPQVAGLDLCVAAAHFDPAEALRPGWPLHRRLLDLHARAPGKDGGPRIIAFGADARGEVPQPLAADPALVGGSLRVLPFLLHGPEEVASAVAGAFEAQLLEAGMAGADTALLLQEGLGARIEHARYLTLHDLAAMVALQYEHLGLAPLWPLIETALLSPQHGAVLDAPPEPLLRYVDGQARMALFAPAAWRERYRPASEDTDRLARMFAHYETRQRQLAAVLGAHGIEVVYVAAEATVPALEL